MNVGKPYLFLYNSAQLLGWCFVLWESTHSLIIYKDANDVYGRAGLAAFAKAQLFLRQSILPWWFGRSNVLFLILHSIPELWSHWAVPVLFIAWALADISRYPWYAAALVGPPPKLLTWLRYTAFIPLYPLGIFGGEMPLIYASLPFLRDRELHSLRLPNRFNFAFNYHYFALAGLFVILPIAFLQLYSYMLMQRSKRLSPRAKTP